MRNNLTLLLFLFLSLNLLATETSTGLQNPVKGIIVTKSDGLPLPGATITLKNTKVSTISDLDGNFTLNVPDENNAVLVISYTGFKTQEIALKGKTTVNIILEESSTSLDEVVVVGYGTQKKGDLTGAISKVKATDLNGGSANLNAAQMLEGRVAGVYINQHSGDPSGEPKINIRGNGTLNVAIAERPNNDNKNPLYSPLIGSSADPLVIVDGFQLSHLRDMNSISPNDIESFTVLKDASATAIYGARGANGVILITTKNGKKHSKTDFNYYAQYGVNDIVKELPLLNASEYLNFYKGLSSDPKFGLNNTDFNLTQTQIDNLIASGVNTNWQNEVLAKPMTLNQSHFLTMNGGTEAIKYSLSGNYFSNHTQVAPGDYERYTGKTRIGYEKGKVGFDVSLSFTNERSDDARNLYNSFERDDNNQDKFTFWNAILADPSQAVYNADGTFTKGNYNSNAFRNHPLFPASVTTSYWIQRTNYINASLRYEILPGLKLNTVVGSSKIGYEAFRNVKAEWNNGNINNKENFASAVHRSTGDSMLELFADYNLKVANKHSLNTLIGVSRGQKNYNDIEAAGYNFLNPDIGFNSLQSSSIVTAPLTSRFRSSNSSFFSRLNYNYSEKYLVQFNLRVDGSSQFGIENKFGYFPSASIGWKINKEPFMKQFSSLWDLKMRLSYGTAGNDNIPNGLTSLVYKYEPYSNGTALQLNGNYVPRPDLTWENIATTNFGIDLGYKNLTATLDLYVKSSTDLLLTKDVPPETGYSSIIVNQGKVENKGVELTVGYNFYNLFGTKLKYSTNFNFSYNESLITDLGGDRVVTGGIYIGRNFRGYTMERKEGYQFNSFYLYHFDGIWQLGEETKAAVYGALPGDPKLRDVNNDNKLNDDDKYHAGNADPTVNLGFTNNFFYKNFEFKTFIQGVFGNKVYNQTRLILENPDLQYLSNQSTAVLDRWTETNPSNTQSSKLRPTTQATVESDAYLDDASFIRLKEINLIYHWKMQPQKQLQELTFGLGVTNVFTITDYKGLNPEVYRTDNQWNINPYTRTFTFSINAKF
jgi:TonB-dependent starch-binding outer membrane protein SusC